MARGQPKGQVRGGPAVRRLSVGRVLLAATLLSRGPKAFAALALVLISRVISYVAGGMAVQRLSASVASGLAYVEPVSACVIAWVLLGQRLSAVQITGGCVVLLGAYTAQRSAAPVAAQVLAPSVEPVGPVAE
jgi:drug/metabolite transporter (DMT)-like permease